MQVEGIVDPVREWVFTAKARRRKGPLRGAKARWERVLNDESAIALGGARLKLLDGRTKRKRPLRSFAP